MSKFDARGLSALTAPSAVTDIQSTSSFFLRYNGYFLTTRWVIRSIHWQGTRNRPILIIVFKKGLSAVYYCLPRRRTVKSSMPSTYLGLSKLWEPFPFRLIQRRGIAPRECPIVQPTKPRPLVTFGGALQLRPAPLVGGTSIPMVTAHTWIPKPGANWS